jgi:hypothetical protein
MKSAGTIIDAIGRMATEGYRQKHLEKDLQGVAKDVDALLAELKKDADVRYVGLLTAEQRAYERQFSVALQDLGAPTSNDPSQLQLIRTLARDDESAQARLIAAKRSAAMSYGKAIDTILSGHRALLDHRGKLDAKDVSGMIQPYTDSLSKLVQPLWQLFGG